jgi:hypothetical protein
VVVAWSEIRTVSKVVKQLPVEMLQLCSYASSCTRKHIVIEDHYTGCQRTTYFVLNSLHSLLIFRCKNMAELTVSRLIPLNEKCLNSGGDYVDK